MLDRHVLVDCQLGAAASAEHCFFSPFTPRPKFNLMASQLFVAILASIIRAAASHFDRDDIQRTGIMDAPRLCVQPYADYLRRLHSHE
jgi:hypothetical protein